MAAFAARGSSSTDVRDEGGVDKGVPPGRLRVGYGDCRPVSVRTAALRGEAGKSGESR